MLYLECCYDLVTKAFENLLGENLNEYWQCDKNTEKKPDTTQEEMANRLGVTTPAVNKWENGGSLR